MHLGVGVAAEMYVLNIIHLSFFSPKLILKRDES